MRVLEERRGVAEKYCMEEYACCEEGQEAVDPTKTSRGCEEELGAAKRTIPVREVEAEEMQLEKAGERETGKGTLSRRLGPSRGLRGRLRCCRG